MRRLRPQPTKDYYVWWGYTISDPREKIPCVSLHHGMNSFRARNVDHAIEQLHADNPLADPTLVGILD